jgi:branched-chain amino acid aminotransferase
MDLACLDGQIGPADAATIPVTDEGFLRGDGVFEVMRLYDGTPFALDDHLRRLATSAANLRLEIDLGALRGDVIALLAAAPPEARDGAVRVLVTRGGRRLALTEPLPPAAESIRLATVTFAPTRILDGVKSLSYAANMLAGRMAKEQGADEALLVTPHGRVLEAPTSSFFWVAGGELLTPPLDDHILASITRARVIDETGASERSCTLDDVEAAEEAFLASTTREVQPVAAVDGRPLRSVPGPVTERAAAALRKRIESELAGAA